MSTLGLDSWIVDCRLDLLPIHSQRCILATLQSPEKFKQTSDTLSSPQTSEKTADTTHLPTTPEP